MTKLLKNFAIAAFDAGASGNRRLQRIHHAQPASPKIAEDTIEHTIDSSSDIQAGFAAINPSDGSVLALVGGRDYEKALLTA
ncbi:hypothetical protein PO124_05275 [Bacillus licheniformis]|nr:hypothetical protein [Bacillus licheniformis]